MRLSQLRRDQGVRVYSVTNIIGVGLRTMKKVGQSSTLFITFPRKTWNEMNLKEGDKIDLDWDPQYKRLEFFKTENSFGLTIRHWNSYKNNLSVSCAIPDGFSIPNFKSTTYVQGEINGAGKLIVNLM